MAKANKTRYAILGMLSIEPMSGYAIRQTMQRSTANFWSESDGQLYPTLAKLEAEGYISYHTADLPSARDKKIYGLTEQGKDALNQWLKAPPEKQNFRNEFMLKIFYGANVTPNVSLAHVQAQRYQIEAYLHELSETTQKINTNHAHSPHLAYWQISLQYGMKIAEAKLKWCDETIQALTKLAAKK
jgi:PadR family transcriptional regulator AphA